jgi:DNA-binding transcriptional MerR regulator
MNGKTAVTAAAAATEKWFSNRDLAARYDVPLKTIFHWRQIGYGPPGIRMGNHVRYDPAEVRRWEQQLAREQAQAREAG